MSQEEELQPKQTDIQPEDQELEENTSTEDDEDFEPKLTAKEYAGKWRSASKEAMKYRKELQALRTEKEKSEKAKLKEQGKYKEMYESLNQEHSNLKSTLQSAARSNAFRNEAIKAGCQPELVELLEKSANLSEIELDDKFRVDKDQVAFEVKQLKEKYGNHFFKKSAKPVVDGDPKNPDVKLKSYSERVRAAKTQKELDALLAERNSEA